MAEFVKSKMTSYKNQPVGVVSAKTGAVELAENTANVLGDVQKIFWQEAATQAIERDVNTANTLPITDVNGKLRMVQPKFSDVGKEKAERIWNQRYENEVTNKAATKFAELHNNNKFDKEKFDIESREYINGWVKAFKDNNMSQYLPNIVNRLSSAQALHSNKILNDTAIRDENIQTTNQQLTVGRSINSLEALMYNIKNTNNPSEKKERTELFNVTLNGIFNNIEELKGKGVKAPAILELEGNIRKSITLGHVNNLVDRLGTRGDLIKIVEQIFQSNKLDSTLADKLIKQTAGKITQKEIIQLASLKNELKLTSADLAYVTRRISDRSGDADKINNALGKQITTGKFVDLIDGGFGSGDINIFQNNKKNRDGINNAFGYKLGREFNIQNFLTASPEEYNNILKQLNNTPILPSALHNLFTTNNIMTVSSLRELNEKQRKAVFGRILNTWKNVAYGTDSSGIPVQRLQGYDDQYFKFNFIDSIARVNGDNIEKAFNITNAMLGPKEQVEGAILTTIDNFSFDEELGLNTLNDKLNYIMEQSGIEKIHYGNMKPYLKKLLFYKQIKQPDGEVVDFSYEGMKDVLTETYKNLYVVDENIIDVFSRDKSAPSYYTYKKKYVGGFQKKFENYINNKFKEEMGVDSNGDMYVLGENAFLLADYKNTQYGDQRYTVVDGNGNLINGIEQLPLEILTKQFEEQFNITEDEINKRRLAQAKKGRIFAIEKDKAFKKPAEEQLGLFDPRFLDMRFGELINSTDIIGDTIDLTENVEMTGPIIPRQFDPTFRSRVANVPIIPSGTETKKEEPVNIKEKTKKLPNVIGIGSPYITNIYQAEGYADPSWQVVTDLNKFTIPEKLRNIYEDIFTPDVAKEVSDTLKTIMTTTARHEQYRNNVYRDRDTISIGFGFNVRYLTPFDYKLMNKQIAEPLKKLQKKLLEREYSTKELNQMANDFKLGQVAMLRRSEASNIYVEKMKDIYKQYIKEFPNFTELNKQRQSALIDFSYQYGHERLKREFPKYYTAISNAINSDEMELRNYYFREAGFHQTYNTTDKGVLKTPLYYQTTRRVKSRANQLGFYIQDNIGFFNPEYSQ